jgi:poly(A) polymerase
MPDIQAKVLRMIGDPAERYREDPVRMLRAARFAAKLDFTLEPATAQPIAYLSHLLSSISHHRLYDESHKLFTCGHLQRLLSMMSQMGLFKALFPLLDDDIAHHPLVQKAAQNTDERLQQGKSVNPAFFYAVLLWQWQQQVAQKNLDNGEDYFPAQQNAAMRVLALQSKSTAIPRYTAQTIRDIWELQPRLEQPKARFVPKLIAQPRFRAGFDFLLLREQSGDTKTNGMGAWWEHYQAASLDEQESLLKSLDRQKAKKAAKAKATTKAATPKPKKPKKAKAAPIESQA